MAASVLIRTVALAFVSITCSCARQPIQMSCTGQMTHVVSGKSWDDSMALTIDLRARTVTVGGFGTARISHEDQNTVVFIANPEATIGISTGTLDRITGVVNMHMIMLREGVLTFHGMCKPAQKLF